MKKLLILLLSLSLSIGLCSCSDQTQGETAFKMYMECAQLTEEEENIVNLLGLDMQQRIFDFYLDNTVQSVQINTYELIGESWNSVSDSTQEFKDSKGRVALSFDKLSEGLRVAIQSEHYNGSDAYEPKTDEDLSHLGYATSTLSDRTEVIYEKEIPLAVQILTTKNEVHSYAVEYFNTPEEYAKHGYEHVYAVTICFSQNKV